MHRIVMDVDTGVDDALALLHAVAHPDIELMCVTCVAGNSGLHQVVANTFKVLDAAGAGHVPVAAGAARPLVETARRTGSPHGSDGLGGVTLPASPRTLVPFGAVDLLARTILDSPEPVTLVACAPLTNVSLLLDQRPEVTANLARIVFSGGSANPDLATRDYNVWQDPEAAATVLDSGIPLSMYGMDVFTQLTVQAQTAGRLRSDKRPAVRLTGELLERRRSEAGLSSPSDCLIGDAGALVLLTRTELFGVARLPVEASLAGPDRGRTRVEAPAPADQVEGGSLVDVVTQVDVEKAAGDFVATIEAGFPAG